MNSSISSSEGGRPRSRLNEALWYTPALLLLVSAGMFTFEWWLRELDPLSQSEKLVYKVLSDPRLDVVIGDSHIGFIDYLEDFAFLGRPGVTMFEIEQTLKAKYRWQRPGRVILEVGPQLFAAKRQRKWRALLPGTLERQRFPWSIYLLEPELLNALQRQVERSFRRYLSGVAGSGLEEKSSGEWVQINWLEQDIVYSDIDRDAHVRYMKNRKGMQKPVNNVEQSPGWNTLVETIGWLLEKKAELCLIRTPVTPEYEAMLDEHGALRQHLHRVQTLADDFGINYVDKALPSEPLELDYFANADHLSIQGHRAYWPALYARCFPR